MPFITGQAFPELYQMLANQTAEFQNMAEATRNSPDPEAQAKVNYLEAVASEHAALIAENATQVAAIASFENLPMIIIGSSLPNPDFGLQAEDFQQFWIEQNRTLAQKSTNGRFILAQDSSHYIHEDVPDIVINAIHELVE
jgi:hypothetical protein